MAANLLLVSAVLYSLVAVECSSPTCVAVMAKYRAKGLLQSDVPSQAVSDSTLQVCSSKVTGCCTKRMEDSFTSLARSEFESALVSNTNDLKNTFANNAKTFNVFFQNLIKKSETDLNSMFIKTYGNFYKQRSQVFTELFQNLKKYYKGERNLDLTQVMNEFFSNLMSQMFQLLNARYKFTDSYLKCVTKHMDELKPFGDMKDKLTSQVKRSFVAARAFVHGLNKGHSVLRQLQALSASKDCEKELIKLSYCSWCLGKTDLKPCEGFCTNSYKVCLADLKQLSHEWETFMGALLDVAGKLEGPFSIENVIDPIGVKISFAIMNYQERHVTVGKKIFTGCGTPNLRAKTKRSSSDSDFFIDEPNKGKVKTQADSKALDRGMPKSGPLTNLGRLTQKFRVEIKMARGFWQRLPSSICAPPNSMKDIAQCWNGTAMGKYTSPGVSFNNIDSSLSPSADTISHQVIVLKSTTSRLKSALEGEDVNVVKIIDEGEGDSSASGSGSGSGSAESGDTNEITIPPTTLKVNTDSNSLDEGDSMLGGGVGNSNDGTVLGNKKDNSCNRLSTYTPMALLTVAVLILRLW